MIKFNRASYNRVQFILKLKIKRNHALYFKSETGLMYEMIALYFEFENELKFYNLGSLFG